MSHRGNNNKIELTDEEESHELDDQQRSHQEAASTMTDKQQTIELLVFIAVMAIQFALLMVMLEVHFH